MCDRQAEDKLKFNIRVYLKRLKLMKKLKIEQLIDNSLNAFFDKSLSGENRLATIDENCVLDKEKSLSDIIEFDAVIKILKQVFVFFPSALYLFFGTMAFFMVDYITSNRFFILSVVFISSVTMVFGIGNIKKPKHLLIPLSVIVLGIVTFLAFSMSGIRTHIWAQNYVGYFLPLVLIIPILVKGWIDRDS